MQLKINFNGNRLPEPPTSSLALVAYLRAQDGPRTAAQCCQALGLEVSESNRRAIRKMAADARPIIVSAPGRPYVHFRNTDADSILAAAVRLDDQIAAETEARDSYLKLYHALAPRTARAPRR